MLPGPSFPRSHRSVPPPHCHSFSRSKFPRDPWVLVALRRLGFHFQPAISPRNRYYFRGEEGKKRKWIGSHRPCNFLGPWHPPKIWIISMYLLESLIRVKRILYLNAVRRRRRRLSSFPFPWSEEFSTTWSIRSIRSQRLEAFFDRSSDIRDFKGMGMGMVFLARFTFCLYAFLNASLWSYRCSITRTYISSRLLLRYSFH